MTASTEITQNASKSANGYKTILTNLMTKDLEKQFNEFGLTMRDLNDGALKDGYTIIQELSGVYEKLGTVWSEDDDAMVSMNDNFNALMEDIAGKHNINVLVSGLQNFDQAINATNSALNSAGSAQSEFETAMGGLTKKLEGLKGQFQELVWGEGGLNILLKGLVDLGTGILKVINDLGGLSTVVTVAIGLLVTFKGALAIDALLKFASGLSLTSGALGTLIMALPNAITAWKAFGAGIITTNTAIQASIPLLGLALTAITLLTLGIAKHNKKLEQQRQQTIETTQAEISSLDSLLEKVKDETLTRESLYELIKDTDAYSKEIEDMEDVNEMRQSVIDKINEEKLARAQELIDVGQTGFEQATQRQKSSTSDFKFTPYYDTRFNEPYSDIHSATGTQQQIDALQKYKDTLVSVRAEKKKGSFDWKQYTKEISNVEAELSSLQSTQKEDILTIEKYNNALGLTGQKYDESTGQIVKMTDAEKIEFNAKQELNKETEEEKDELLDYEQTLKSLDATLSILSGTTISGLADAFNLLKDAQSEINDTGKLSIDTYEALMNLGAEYQAILFDENGELRTNKEATLAVYNAKIDEMAITSARNMIDLAVKLSDEGKSFADLANNTGSATKAGWEQIAVMMAELELSDKDSKALQVRIDGIKQWAEQAKKNVGTYNQTTKAINEQKKALDKLKDEYKAVTEYIEDQLESEISRIEDAKNAELDRIDSTIEALKKKRNAEEDYWDNRISTLEEQNKAIEKQIELEKLQENLALARNKKVMVMGANGWEIREDEQAVAQAEQDIADYTRKQQAQTEIDILNKLKETALANYDSQIQAQEEFRARQESAFDAQIDYFKNYKNQFNDMVDSYENEQNRLLALQLTGIDFEQQGWQTRLSGLSNFVANYISKLKELQKANEDYEKSQGEGNGNATTSSPTASTSSPTISTPTPKQLPKNYYVYKTLGAFDTNGEASSKIGMLNGDGVIKVGNKYLVVKWKSSGYSSMGEASSNISRYNGNGAYKRYYTGSDSIDSNQMALVGDNPNNRELVIGSKLNGQIMNLSKGTGVVNAKSTNTLAGILNNLGGLGNIGQTVSNATKSVQNYFNITANVQDGEGLVDYLQNFSASMTQKAFS